MARSYQPSTVAQLFLLEFVQLRSIPNRNLGRNLRFTRLALSLDASQRDDVPFLVFFE